MRRVNNNPFMQSLHIRVGSITRQRCGSQLVATCTGTVFPQGFLTSQNAAMKAEKGDQDRQKNFPKLIGWYKHK